MTDAASTLPIVVTRFDSMFTPGRYAVSDTTWGQFVSDILRVGHRQDLMRESAPQLALYSLRPGGQRRHEDVQRVYGVCLDFDDVPRIRVVEAAARLQAVGAAVLWHTTWSHGLKGERRRLIVPLAKSILASDYDRLLSLIMTRYASAADHQAVGVSRGFLVPSCHPERAAGVELIYLPGGGLDVIVPSAPPLAQVVPRESNRVLDLGTYHTLAKRWASAKNMRTVDLANRLQKVLDGLPFAEIGERDQILWELLRALVRVYPDLHAASCVALFERSLERMAELHPADHLSAADVLDKLERARSSLDSHLSADRRAAIRQAYGTDREQQYSTDELEAIRARLGIEPEQMARTWILQHEQECYLVGHDRLYWTGQHAFANAARVVLSPAPIELQVAAENGPRWMGRAELLERYSTPLNSVVKSLCLQEPCLDLQARTLHLPAAPRRNIEPRFDVEIDTWLQLLVGEAYPTLCQWLSYVPRLDRPLTALVLTGPRSVGKSLLANGLARIWSSSGPSSLIDAMGAFNATLERCPFCHADESELPRDAQGIERTGALREFIQSTTRLLNEKFQRAIPLVGATRVQISANNDDILNFRGTLTSDDVGAISERLTRMKARKEAAVWLADRGGRDYTMRWIEGDALPAHVLYLAERLQIPWQGRFGIAGEDLIEHLAVRGRLQAQICELVVRAIKQPALNPGCRVREGRVHVTVEWILRHWDTAHRRQKQPNTSEIGRALLTLGESLEDSEGRWTILRTEALRAWVEEANFERGHYVTESIAAHIRVTNQQF